MKDYARVNNDSQKSKKKSKEIFLEAVKENKGIVIDNTNKSRDQRSEYMKLAEENGYRKIAFRFTLDKKASMAFNKLRYFPIKDQFF